VFVKTRNEQVFGPTEYGQQHEERNEAKEMTNPFERDDATYHVIVNADGQYSIWPVFKDVPRGWSAAVKSSTRRECLEWIGEHWKDMRPKSLVVQMDTKS
jgi:MbtH protein